MNKKTVIIPALFFLVTATAAHAQSINDYENYMAEAGHNSILYKGRIDKPINYKYNGTYFAYEEAFTQGEVVYNGKSYHNIWMNLNSYRDELNVRLFPVSFMIVLDKNLVESFVMNGRKFINIKGQSIPDGYYELLYDGKSDLLKKVTKKKYEEESNTAKIVGFLPAYRYYILKDSVYYPVKGKNSFVSYFPADKKNIRMVYRHLSFSEQDDKDILYKIILEQGCNQ